MFLSDSLAPHFERHQLMEVVCQLRFSPILSIDTREPADFQEAIRSIFPRYSVRKEQLPPRLVAIGTPNAKLEPSAPVNNYCFSTADGNYRINLTKNYISFATTAYPGWEKFAGQLDRPLAEFIRIYQPAFFEHLELRYLNAFSRAALGLEHTPWRDLFADAYLGPLLHEDIHEQNFAKVSLDTDLSLGGSCRARIHSGTGMIKRNVPGAPLDKEVKFILDITLAMPAQTEPRLAAAGLETLHRYASSIFNGAITDKLRSVLGPDR